MKKQVGKAPGREGLPLFGFEVVQGGERQAMWRWATSIPEEEADRGLCHVLRRRGRQEQGPPPETSPPKELQGHPAPSAPVRAAAPEPFPSACQPLACVWATTSQTPFSVPRARNARPPTPLHVHSASHPGVKLHTSSSLSRGWGLLLLPLSTSSCLLSPLINLPLKSRTFQV